MTANRAPALDPSDGLSPQRHRAWPKRSALRQLGAASGLAIASTWACTQSAAVNPSYVPVASGLIVSPTDFLGDVPCNGDAGAMQTYRATLIDVTTGEHNAFPLASSTLVTCSRDVLFEGVTAGNRYTAQIEAFNRDDLEIASGLVVDSEGTEVDPTWTTTCEGDRNAGQGGQESGDGRLGVLAFAEARLFVRGCNALKPVSPGDPASARFAFEDIFPGLECGTADGATSFTVFSEELAAGGAPASSAGGAGGAGGAGAPDHVPGETSSPCDTPIVLDDLEPHRSFSFSVEAYAAGSSSAGWATACDLRSVPGVERSPECDAFRTTSGE